MDANGIVEAMNRRLKSLNAEEGIRFILHKLVKPSFIKAYVQYDYTLWYVIKDRKYQVKRIVHMERSITDKEKKDALKYMENELIDACFSLLQDKDMMELFINGKFEGYGI